MATLGFAVMALALPPGAARAQPTPEGGTQGPAPGNVPPSEATNVPATPPPPPSPEEWAIHGQSTFVEQFHPGFASAYSGPNSLDSGRRGDETFDATLFAGHRLWQGAEIWVNGEIDQGFGFNNTLGIADFPSAEAYKVGEQAPYVRAVSYTHLTLPTIYSV